MPFIGSIIPHRVAGLDPKAQRLRREREEKKRATGPDESTRSGDEAELSSVEQIEAPEALRGPKAPDSEEGREDREKLGYYEPDGTLTHNPPPSIDLEG